MNVFQTARIKTKSQKYLLFVLIASAAAYGIWEVRGVEWMLPAFLGTVFLGVFFESVISAFVAKNERRLLVFELKRILACEERVLLTHTVKLVGRSQELIPSESERGIIEALWQTGEKSHRWDIIVRTMQSSAYVLHKQADGMKSTDPARRICRHQFREKKSLLFRIKSRRGELSLRRQYLEVAVHTLQAGIDSSKQVILATQKMLREVGELA